jgi:DNA-directed RNA polymerase specialized sigma subunit
MLDLFKAIDSLDMSPSSGFKIFADHIVRGKV